MQAPDPTLQQRLQDSLVETEEQTSSRFHHAAQELSDAIPIGCGGLHGVMRRLLAATWLKSHGRIVDGWHALSTAVREAQESGTLP